MASGIDKALLVRGLEGGRATHSERKCRPSLIEHPHLARDRAQDALCRSCHSQARRDGNVRTGSGSGSVRGTTWNPWASRRRPGAGRRRRRSHPGFPRWKPLFRQAVGSGILQWSNQVIPKHCLNMASSIDKALLVRRWKEAGRHALNGNAALPDRTSSIGADPNVRLSGGRSTSAIS
jgi:hypothetical protein